MLSILTNWVDNFSVMMDSYLVDKEKTLPIRLVSAGSSYLDIDAYACCVAMAELLRLKGEGAIAWSNAKCNYSVCESLVVDGQLVRVLPAEILSENAQYIIVDVSDPDYIRDAVPLEQVIEVYDHHVGFEEFWANKIGDGAHIEFIGAAATLIYREWKRAGLQSQMKRSTALLLIAAILDNTLNLMSSNTTPEDVAAYNELCQKENTDEAWCAKYFSEVQEHVEADLKNAIFGDLKTVCNNCLPPRVAQLCVWDTSSILKRLPEIQQWFSEGSDSWMLNLIDLKYRCSYFVCDDADYQKKISKLFGICFEAGVAKTPIPYLRKEIIKKTYFYDNDGG